MPSSAAKAEPSRLRAAARLVALLLWLALLAPLHILTKALTGASPWPRRFLSGAARIVGANVVRVGSAPDPHSLLVANHVSWLDIIVLNAATGCAFVSKAEVRGTPLVGWLAEQNRTVYVERRARRAARAQATALLTALDHPQPVALFPEGTTGDGRSLLPFRSTLFEAVTPVPPHVTVRPVAIDYGAALAEVAWVGGEPGVANALRVLGRKGRFDVHVAALEPLDSHADRKAMAAAARTAIGRALGLDGGASAGADKAL